MKNIRVILNIGEPFEGLRLSQYLDWDRYHLCNFYWSLEKYLKEVLLIANWRGEFPWTVKIDCVDDADSRQYDKYSTVFEFLNDLQSALQTEDERLQE